MVAAEQDTDVVNGDDVEAVERVGISLSFIGVPVPPPTITLVITPFPGCGWDVPTRNKMKDEIFINEI